MRKSNYSTRYYVNKTGSNFGGTYYEFKTPKVYHAFREYEREHLYSEDNSFVSKALKAGFESYRLCFDRKSPSFYFIKDKISPTLNYFGVSTYSPDWCLIKGSKSLCISLQGVLCTYSDRIYDESVKEILSKGSAKYIKLQDNEDIIYETFTGILPDNELFDNFILQKAG